MLIGGWSDVALCSDLAALAYNRFERCALLRCGIVFYAINAPTLNFGPLTLAHTRSRPMVVASTA